MKFSPRKSLLVNLACGHSLVIERENVARIVKGTQAECPKCNYKLRRIVEQSWVDPKRIGE